MAHKETEQNRSQQTVPRTPYDELPASTQAAQLIQLVREEPATAEHAKMAYEKELMVLPLPNNERWQHILKIAEQRGIDFGLVESALSEADLPDDIMPYFMKMLSQCLAEKQQVEPCPVMIGRRESGRSTLAGLMSIMPEFQADTAATDGVLSDEKIDHVFGFEEVD